MVTRTLKELADELNGELLGDGSIEIRDVAGIREALPGDLTFIANSRYDAYLEETRASAVICARDTRQTDVPLILVDNPYLAFQQAVRIFRPIATVPLGIHPTAWWPMMRSSAKESRSALVVINRARRSARVVVGPRFYRAAGEIGEDKPPLSWGHDPRGVCWAHAASSIRERWWGATAWPAFDQGRYHKVPQAGTVIETTEIGANTTIDRATTHSTRIGDGSKIDNLQTVTTVIGSTASWSRRSGSRAAPSCGHVTIGGQAGLVGHISGRGRDGGRSEWVTKPVAAHTVVTG
jgi:UDP-3-O-[3-hydroxymyristoyl] glucosamine N-acyltransferase